MATKVTRDHHLLSRNLKLNGNYLSNDGDDEGISIANDGDVTMTSNDRQLTVAYDANNYTYMKVADDGELDIVAYSGDDNSNAGITFNAGNGTAPIGFKGVNTVFYPSATGVQSIQMNLAGAPRMVFNSTAASADELALQVNANGASEIMTEDKDDENAAHLTLDIEGDIKLDPNTGITRFMLAGDPNDYASLTVAANGVTTLATFDDGGAVGHLNIEADGHVEFDGCGVGFDKETTTFAAAAVTSEGDDSTDIDFRLGNKHELTLTDDIAGSGEYINLIFPATSGNFLLVLIQGVADCTVHSTGWVAYQSDGSTLGVNELGANGTDGRVRWAGGSAPTLSTSQYDVDVVSFYWDADNGTVLGVASLDFG